MAYHYHYNPEQPRDNKGKWVDVTGYEFGDRIVGKDGTGFVYQDPAKVKDASKLVHATGIGRLYSSFKENDPRGERAYIDATQWGEQRISVHSPRGFMSIVDKDSADQEDTYSFCRGAERQPLGKDASAENPGLGGRPAQLTNRKDGVKTYDAYDVTGGELATYLAMGNPMDHRLEPDGYKKMDASKFNDPKNVGEANFEDVARQVAETRQYYMHTFGVDEAQARNMDVRVSIGENGLEVSPAYRSDARDMSKRVHVDRNEEKKNSGVVFLRARDLTTFANGMRRTFGNQPVRCAVGEGTGQTVNGGYVRNALYIQQEKTGADGHRLHIRGSVEKEGFAGARRIRHARDGKDKMFNGDRNQREYEDSLIRRRGVEVQDKGKRNAKQMAAIVSVRRGVETRASALHETKDGQWELKRKEVTTRYDRNGNIVGFTNIHSAKFAVEQVKLRTGSTSQGVVLRGVKTNAQGVKEWHVVDKASRQVWSCDETGKLNPLWSY